MLKVLIPKQNIILMNQLRIIGHGFCYVHFLGGYALTFVFIEATTYKSFIGRQVFTAGNLVITRH